MTVFSVNTPDDLLPLAGQTAGPTRWFEISAERIQAFAAATDDFQWIHLDGARTQAELGHAPVAHGYLTLSMVAPMMYELVSVAHVGRIINYGVNKVRFITPVLAGDSIRATASVARASREDGFVRVIHDVTVMVDRVDKPAMIAQLVILYFDSTPEVKNG